MLMRAVDEAATYDGHDLTNSAGWETVFRHAQLIEYTHVRDDDRVVRSGGGEKGGGKSSSSSGLVGENAVFGGSHRHSGEAMIMPELMDFVANEVERDADVMKQVRRAREERRLLQTGAPPPTQ